MPFFRITPDRDRPAGWNLFSILGIPVFIEPGFLIMIGLIFLMQSNGSRVDFPAIGLWCFVLFFSILFHELGHALTARMFGCDRIRIALVMMGGLAYHSPTTRGRSIIICFAGPLFGLALGTVAYILFRVPRVHAIGPEGAMTNVLVNLIFVNIFWTLFNLVPIYPLDGGQALFHALTFKVDPHRAIVWAARVSLVGAALAGGFFYFQGYTFGSLLCAFLFMNNFQMAGILN